jgi:hypothetical protein
VSTSITPAPQRVAPRFRRSSTGDHRLHAGGVSTSTYATATNETGDHRLHAGGISPSTYAATNETRDHRLHAGGISTSTYAAANETGDHRLHAGGISTSTYSIAANETGDHRLHAGGVSTSTYPEVGEPGDPNNLFSASTEEFLHLRCRVFANCSCIKRRLPQIPCLRLFEHS